MREPFLTAIHFTPLMDIYFLTPPSIELTNLAKTFGYTHALFQNKDFVYGEVSTVKDAQKLVSLASSLKVLSIAKITSDNYREIIEKTNLTMITGIDQIASSDSLHQVRGGVDQVIAPLLKARNITLLIPFTDILHNPSAKTIARMRFNIYVAKKYKVNIILSSICLSKHDLRTVNDIHTFFKTIEKI